MNRKQSISWILVLTLWALPAASDQDPQDEQLERAVNAYVDGDYPVAHRLFEPLAEAGRSEAQYFLGIMYERGFAVRRDPVRAQAWYLRASRLHNRQARQASSRLAADLSVAESRRAESLAHEERIVLDRDHGCISFFGEAFQSHYVTVSPAHTSVDRMVSDILGHTGLAKNFIVQAANVPNAAAIVQGSTRYLLYNPRFIQEVNNRSGTPWAAYSVMAHEIGHHLQGHTIQPGGSRPSIELQADSFSGFILARMGASLDESQAAMTSIAGTYRSSTHPGRDERLAAIAGGWKDAVSKGATPPSGSRPPPSTPNVQQPPPLPVPSWPVAKSCRTLYGECRMQVVVPVGSVCYCVTPFGNLPGYAR